MTDTGFETAPPQDIDAEQSVLGGMLLSKDAIADVVEVLKGADFYRPAHEAIYATILDLYGRGEPADPITVRAELTRRGEIVKVGGPPYLHTLVNAVPTAANAEYYAHIVRQKAALRRLREVGLRIVQDVDKEQDDPGDILDQASAELHAVADDAGTEQHTLIGDGFEEYLDELEAFQRDGQDIGVPTGFSDLDKLTGGLQPGQMVIVAGRPAIGKSVLGVDFARACSIANGMPSVVFSLEMGRKELMNRVMSAQARVGLHHIRSKGGMDDADWDRYAKTMQRVTAAPLHIIATPNQTLMQIRAQCRRLQQRGGLRLVVIDYLQLMQSGASRRTENRQVEVSEMSRGIKLLAKELDVPIVVLCQLNRGPEQRADKKPAMSDLRESGSLEQDADIVILVHREDAYEKESPRAGEADLIVAKHRNGPTATITVAFQGHYSRFVDMAQS